MKKSPLALAALALSCAASAQSSLTIFGNMDAGVSRYETKSSYNNNGNTTAPAGVAQSVGIHQTALSTSALSGSRLGFRGTEDLGGGLAAGFWLEAPLNNDTGDGALSFTRRSTVSLFSPLGELRVGRDYTPTYNNDLAFDPFNTNGVGSSLVTTVGSKLATARAAASGVLTGSDNYLRANNTIGYFLPKTLGGVYGQAMYSLHENNSNSPNGDAGRYVGAQLGYADGPWNIATAYARSTVSDSAALGDRIDTFNVGATYDMKVVKLFGQWSKLKDDSRVRTVSTKDDYDGLVLGVHVPIGYGNIRFAYSQMKFDSGSASTPDSTVRKLALGYVYRLSLRTSLYATAAYLRFEDGRNNAPGIGVVAGGSPAYAGTNYAPHSATGYNFGIRHLF